MIKTERSKPKLEHTPLDEELLHQINENIPAKTCAAHPILLIYIKNITKNVNEGFQEINDKIDPINDYFENLAIAEKASEQVEKDEIKTEKKWEIKRNKILPIVMMLLFMITVIIGIFTFLRGH
jgi:uncharacterized membrane protein YvbJ